MVDVDESAIAVRVEVAVDVPGPALGRRSRDEPSLVVGFWGIVGCTPSRASQCAMTVSIRRS